jgi:hypothetical protein
MAAIGALLIIGLASSATWTIWITRQAELDRASKDLARSSLVLGEHTAQMFQSADLILEGIEQRLALNQFTTIADFRRRVVAEDVHQLLQDKIQDAPQLNVLAVVSGDGFTVNFSRWWPLEAINVTDRNYFITQRDNPNVGPWISEPIRSRGIGTWITYLAKRVNGPDGQFLGVLLAGIENSYLESFYRKIVPGAEGSISLFRNDGVLIARYPPTDDDIGRSYAGSFFFHSLLENTNYETVFTPASAFDGKLRMIVPHHVGNYPLLINVTNSVDAILADWRRESIAIVGATGAAIVLVLFAGVLFRRQFRLREKMAQSVADRRRAENARVVAEDASRSKSAFLANMSHELRTPLNAIIGFSELTRDAAFGPLSDRYREYAQDINAAGQHLLEVISDLLDMARMEAGKLQLQESEFDLTELVEETYRLILRDAAKSGLALTMDIPPEMPLLLADRLRLKQILLNLLSNAVKFTRQGGRINLFAVQAPDDSLLISVADTGIGMSAAEKERALQPFEQIDNSMHRQADGVGLGLPLTKALIELHGGRLEIETVPGAGTTARIWFPATRMLQEQKLIFRGRSTG